jgi:hypothetical protein
MKVLHCYVCYQYHLEFSPLIHSTLFLEFQHLQIAMVEMKEFCPDDSPFSKLFLPVMGPSCDELVEYLKQKRAKLARPGPRKQMHRLFYRKMRARAARVTYKKKLMYDVFKMMYVSGETAEPSSETTGMVEEIVRQQVIEMVCSSIANLQDSIRVMIHYNTN